MGSRIERVSTALGSRVASVGPKALRVDPVKQSEWELELRAGSVGPIG